MAKTPDTANTGKSDLFRQTGGHTEKPHNTLVCLYFKIIHYFKVYSRDTRLGNPQTPCGI